MYCNDYYILLEEQFVMCHFHYCSLFLISNIATEDMLYTESDLEKSMDKIETIHFHQVCFNLQLYHYIIVTYDIQSSISSSFLFFTLLGKGS